MIQGKPDSKLNSVVVVLVVVVVADPCVSDFLLTHKVFMPSSQLCPSLQHQYPDMVSITVMMLWFELLLLLVILMITSTAQQTEHPGARKLFVLA